MLQRNDKNPDVPQPTANRCCDVCQDLLVSLERFFEILEAARNNPSELLTVEAVAKELKISKSIVYRLIRHGELKAVDLVQTDEEPAKKGHYRIRRSNLSQFLESREVKPLPQKKPSPHPRAYPSVKNHLGL